MGRLIRYLVLSIVLFCAVFVSAKSDGAITEIRKIMYEKGAGIAGNSSGYDFYVAIAPNEAETYTSYMHIELYIASQEPTEVDMYFAGNKIETFKLIPYELKVIQLDAQKCEIRKSETPLRQMYRFVSKNAPISIYELNSKNVTSEGAMILPVSAYGTEYIHCSYWENGSTDGYFKSGFIIMSSQDNTTVTINLKSVQKNIYSKTDKGHYAGDVWKVVLQKGECYKVCTDAGTKGEFDISGTMITSDKPVGLVSFHERATIPRLMSSSRNHLVEMLPPTSAWGKSYYSVEFNRPKGGGDLFRVICKEPQTTWNASWYDLKSGVRIDKRNGILEESGDFVDIIDKPDAPPYGQIIHSVCGTSRFWADKPIQVFQYSFSSGWDDSDQYDPFYITLCPIDNYTNKTTFQIPSYLNFINNWYNLIAVGDSSSAINNAKLLGSILIMKKNGTQIDTLKVINNTPQFLTNRIPGTNMYWTAISLQAGAYSISGDTKFGGYIYGFSSIDGYGWPAGSSFSNVYERDFYPPIVEHFGDQCGNWTIHFTENNVDPQSGDPDNIRQVDLGVDEAPRLLDASYNAKIVFPNSSGVFPNNTPQKDYTFTVKPINTKKDMYAVIRIADRASNISYDTLFYKAPALELQTSDTIDFGRRVRFDTNPIQKRILVNKTDVSLNIYGIYLSNNQSNQNQSPFRIVKGHFPANSQPLVLNSGDSLEIQIQFNPQKEIITEYDTLKIQTLCDVVYNYPVKGISRMPKIQVEDCNFDFVRLGKTKFSSDFISIQNKGSDSLTIFSFSFADTTEKAFTLGYGAKNIKFPLSIAPGKHVFLSNFIIFAPEALGEFKNRIIFSHNGAKDGDSVSILTGISEFPTPKISNLDFKSVKINTSKKDSLLIMNYGSDDISISKATFLDNGLYTSVDGNFVIDDKNIVNKVLKPYSGYPENRIDEVGVVYVTYTPHSIGSHKALAKLSLNYYNFTSKMKDTAVIVGEGSYTDEVNEVPFSILNISPNPIFGSSFTIDVPEDISYNDIHLSIIDESSKLIKSFDRVSIIGGKIQVSTVGIISGNYFVKIKYGDKEIIQKIIIIK